MEQMKSTPLRAISICLIGGAVIGGFFSSPALAQQPNIILFYPDQLRAFSVGAYGDSTAITPNMDTLAANGIRFNNCFPGLPVCTPARACVLTGRMPFSVQSSSDGYDWMIVNRIEMHDKEITIAEELNQLGYTCGHVGPKWHVSEVGNIDCIPNRQGFTYFEGLNSYGKYTESLYCDNNGNKVTYAPGERWLSDVYAERAINFINTYHDQPFFLNVWMCPPHAYGGLSWAQYHSPSVCFTTDRMYLYNQAVELTTNDLRLNVPLGGDIETLAKHQLQVYNAMVTGIDDCLGQILAALTTHGIADNTIIIISADHGGQMGSHAFSADGSSTEGWEKNQPHEESIRVPLIVYDPRNTPPSQVRDELIPQMDFLPTILELAGGGSPQNAQGRSFAPLITGQGSYASRDAIMVQYNTMRLGGLGYGWSRVLRNDRWTYVVREITPNTGNLQPLALFDNQNDPYQMNNLINNSAYDTIESQLHARLITEMLQLDDPLIVTPKPEIWLSTHSIDVSIPKGVNPLNDSVTIMNNYVSTLNYNLTDNAGWLSCTPTSGSLDADETDDIIISYAATNLNFGSYTAVITASDPNASNNPQQLTVNLTVYIPGDYDDDSDVDQEDFGKFQACFSGNGNPCEGNCYWADFDFDLDVDVQDFNIFSNCMAGPNQPPGC